MIEKEFDMRRALVTGGAGFIGSNLVHRLVKDGWNVDVVDDFSSGKLDLLKGLTYDVYVPSVKGWTDDRLFWWRVPEQSHPGALPSGTISTALCEQGIPDPARLNIFYTSFDHPYVLARVKKGMYDVVFHQAAIPRVSYSVEEPGKTTDVNVGATVHLLEVCKGNVSRVVFASSSSVYGGEGETPTIESCSHRPKSPYALQKSVDEQFIQLFCHLYDLDAVCLRYFNVFGPGQYGGSAYSTAVSAWCHAIRHGEPLRSDGNGTQTRDMCYVDNVVDANILAAEHTGTFRGTAFNIACGAYVSNRDILDFLTSRYPSLTINHAPWRPGDVMHTHADITAAKSILGYEPKVTFWPGLERTLKWWHI
jgi:nucleoside-diphosphate-sugar epimerase